MRRRRHFTDPPDPVPSDWTVIAAFDKFKTWRYQRTEWLVKHCGHPTALWPWYGLRPDGSMVLSPNGRAFQYLADCQAQVAYEAEENPTDA